ncbi:hypothetical protein KAR91_68055 [Candidatus Pacearchaeota archaeon]|nr:hypothetical protein [Candidatus Pacearchaeota archaeon]
MPVEKTGQEAGSLPAGETAEQIAANAAAEAAKGQGAGTPTGDETGKGAVTKTDEDGNKYVEIEGEKFYSSFDKHPEWRVLKDAKDDFQSILDNSQFANKEELITALEKGATLSDLIGDQDAATVLEAANKWNQAEEYWAQEEANKAEEGESEAQTIIRLKQEKAELVNQQKTEKERTTEQRTSREAVKVFNAEISTAVEGAELAESESALTKLVLGLDNPMDDVDINDTKAVRLAVKDNLGKAGELIKAIRQSAVDDYVANKGKITPIPKSGEGAAALDTGAKFTVKEGETQEQALGRANAELIEFMNASVKNDAAA